MAHPPELFVKIQINEDAVARTENAVSSIRAALEQLEAQVSELRQSLYKLAEPFVAVPPESGDYHDENTLDKVRAVFAQFTFRARGANIDYDPDALITIFLNEGILFRERRKDG